MKENSFLHRASGIVACILALGSAVTAFAQQPYFTKSEMPDLIQCLPAPPDTIGEDFAHDILRYMWGKTQRADTLRAEMVNRDAVWTREGLFGAFEEAFGLPISRTGTPAIWRVLDNSIATVDSTRIDPKAYYHRKRPFERFNESLLTSWEEEELRGEGSYPSGHTMRGWLTALLLTQIHPEAADALFARGWTYGENRVIAGAHWQSDVDASRVGASIGYSRLQTSPVFRAEMAAAQQEFRQLAETRAAVSSATGPGSFTTTAATGPGSFTSTTTATAGPGSLTMTTTTTAGQGASTTTVTTTATAFTTTVTDGREHFVSLAETLPDAILEIRYFSSYNFVGTRVDGYLAPIALMTRIAADSLRAASDDFLRLGYRIKVYDAYRPQMAVDHFVRWAADLTATEMKPYFYPDVDKSVLFDEGYIAAKSGHTRGSTVDLTLVEMATGKEVDMGGVFDWFGIESHPYFCGDPDTQEFQGKTGCARKRLERKAERLGLDATYMSQSIGLSRQQFANRMLLRTVMLRHGFKPIDSEWWHFTLKDEPFPDTYFTFSVQ